MESSETPFLAALARISLIPAPELGTALKFFGSARRLWQAPSPALWSSGLKPSSIGLLVRERRQIDPDREMTIIYKEGVNTLTWLDEHYPPQLKPLPGAPPILFFRGSAAAFSRDKLVAVVGTRRVTNYGVAAAKLLCRSLAGAGVGIVSGLALGVDAIAHQATLDAGGLTVAVLGSGVDRASVGPRSNAALAEKIVDGGGALVSEYPPGMAGHKLHFPLRNRIIAGLSSGVIVVEAAVRSGALITAAAALEYGREVFAVPGPINQPTSGGANELLRQGAVPATSGNDILDHFSWHKAPRGPAELKNLDETQRSVCRELAGGPLGTEILAARTGLDISRLSTAIARLEISGAIEKIGDRWTPRFDSPRQRRLI